MAYFMKSGNTYRIARKEALDITEHLPGGNYTVNKDEMTGQLYLEKIDSFNLPKKIYGDCLRHTDRIVKTFMDRGNATGVMMTGEKGAGKTLLTKNVCVKLSELDIPTLVINAPWCGDKFNNFIQSIEQPCAILFDEFEKVYDRDDQEKILTLLDGVFPSKKLFLLTSNDKWRVDFHMRNRPGRIFYMLDFKGVDAGFIREYCQDNLDAKDHIERIVNISTMFREFNFDMLKALVEEMNRYGETPQQALSMLNAKPEFDGETKYEVTIVHQGKDIDYKGDYRGNPLSPEGVEIGFDPDPLDSEADYIHKVFTASTLVTVKNGQFVFEDKGTRIMLTRKEERKVNYWDAF
jgi:hypothetical protein